MLAAPRSRLTINGTRSSLSGFTIVELLVVIAIIGILAAIILPVLSKAREKGRQSACESNQKQILTGIIMYTQDYDEKLPPIYVKSSDGSRVAVWNQIIEPLIKNQGVFQCGSDESQRAPSYATTAPNVPTGLPEPFHTSYLANVWVLGTGGKHLAEVKQPATTILICDGGVQANAAAPYINEICTEKTSSWVLGDLSLPTPSAPLAADATNEDWAGPSVRHTDNTNVGFIDGHVKAMKPDDWYVPASPWLNPAQGGGAG